ncbi:MAG: hypothetical protein EHM33_22370 [Chloroflexi bacterium]|nr:MAG: hypothetical protein EHM33_22370 [Chloroflexota bacterium]
MDSIVITRIIAIVGFVIGLLGILVRLRDIMNRPFKNDLARGRGSPLRGVLFAFTLGMAPWEKESTRIHWLAYLRGIFFHVGIFMAFGVLLASPWLSLLPDWLVWIATAVTGIGALFGFAGIFMRLAGPNERMLSLPDDYASVFLTSLFTALASATLIWSNLLPAFYVTAGVMMAYIPISKIRHCVYFFYSKFFFGFGFGRRGVIGQPNGEYAEQR